MIDRQTQRQLDEIAHKIKMLRDDNMMINKAEVSLSGLGDYDCIDVIVDITTSKALSRNHFIVLIDIIRKIIRDEGMDEWCDVKFRTNYIRPKE